MARTVKAVVNERITLSGKDSTNPSDVALERVTIGGEIRRLMETLWVQAARF